MDFWYRNNKRWIFGIGTIIAAIAIGRYMWIIVDDYKNTIHLLSEKVSTAQKNLENTTSSYNQLYHEHYCLGYKSYH